MSSTLVLKGNIALQLLHHNSFCIGQLPWCHRDEIHLLVGVVLIIVRLAHTSFAKAVTLVLVNKLVASVVLLISCSNLGGVNGRVVNLILRVLLPVLMEYST